MVGIVVRIVLFEERFRGDFTEEQDASMIAQASTGMSAIWLV